MKNTNSADANRDAVEREFFIRDLKVLLKQLIQEGLNSAKLDPVLIETVFKSLSSDNKELASTSTGLFFSSFVEPLLDSFTPQGREVYYHVFSSIIQLARKHPAGGKLDTYLNGFDLIKKGDLLRRKERILTSRNCTLPAEKIKKVFILSRVTIGADVAITSIIVEKTKLFFPGAKIFLIGNPKMGELFFDEEKLEIIPVRYRTETFFSRLDSIIDIASDITGEMQDDFVLFDPDSRFTQLGLLPLMDQVSEDQRYYFYQSTVKEEPPSAFNKSVNNWFDTTFEKTRRCYGAVSLSAEHRTFGEKYFKENGLVGKFTVTANFGVGGNESKRIGGGFERELVKLILGFGVYLLLDEGFGNEEGERVKHIRQAFSDNPRLITFQAGIGEFSSLIKKSSLYLGYDSMGQHVAAACSIPEIIIFKGYSDSLFPVRWAPVGKNSVDTILANKKSSEEVLRQVEILLKKAMELQK